MRIRPLNFRPNASLASFLTCLLSATAFAQGSAADLAGIHWSDHDVTPACSTRARDEALGMALTAMEDLCEEQNVRLREAGSPSCAAGQCADALTLRSNEPPLPFEVVVAISSGQDGNRLTLGFKFPLGGSEPRAGWSIACRAPYDFLAWRGQVPRTVDGFDRMLKALPTCQK